ncbi:hypothetical protein CHK_1725 [Christensenella hongkongensis]|uniref:Uncharacterized protein n=1 Tax=Christensenella hongkongensis TaxID=270498 RepID=A0A0M2NE47_9FIRM|nr:hypothetical protein CHK_1725 [Christensenella hongkongensis]
MKKQLCGAAGPMQSMDAEFISYCQACGYAQTFFFAIASGFILEIQLPKAAAS